jgi:hypothetical protein
MRTRANPWAVDGTTADPYAWADERPSGDWLMTEVKAAERLGFSRHSLRSARSTGTGALASLPYVKIGKHVRYSYRDVEAWLARQPRHECAS